MAYDDIFQPGIYKSWTEAIIKEQKIRMKWQEDYEARQKEEQAFEADGKDDKTELPCTCKGKGGWTPETESKMDWPRNGATGTNTLIRVLDTSSSMIYPSPVVRSLLYEGISKDGKGREGYLKRRWRSDPEKRFHTTVCTNWIYGWNHGKDNELMCKDPDNCDIRDVAFGLR